MAIDLETLDAALAALGDFARRNLTAMADGRSPPARRAGSTPPPRPASSPISIASPPRCTGAARPPRSTPLRCDNGRQFRAGVDGAPRDAPSRPIHAGASHRRDTTRSSDDAT